VDNTVAIVPGRADFHALSDPGADALSMHIPTGRFRDFVFAASGFQELRQDSTVHSFQVSTDAANLPSQIKIVDLCLIAGVSLSTLERVFRNELKMTPLAYIKARRLDAVRRSLISSDSDTPIAQLAYDHGISRVGRFAADYRQQFGVLPSEQRQN